MRRVRCPLSKPSRSTRLAVAAAALTLSVAVAGTGPVVTVLHADGRLLPGVAVVCVRGGSGTGLTDEQGRVTLSEGCLEVECMHGGLVTGRARIVDGAATCTVAEAVVILGEIRGAMRGELYVVQAVSSERRPAPQGVPVDSGPTPGPRRFRVEVPAGSYGLRVFRWDDYWSCSADLGSLAAGEREVVVEWREPTEVRGIVLDSAGHPFGRVLLHLVYESGDMKQPDKMRCEKDINALDVISERDGRFVALVDPERPYRIVADDAWQPATVQLDAER